jgi:hypothetical protein
MAVSGLPEPCECHARCIARLALDIMDLSKKVKTEDMNGIVCHIIILFFFDHCVYSFISYRFVSRK